MAAYETVYMGKTCPGSRLRLLAEIGIIHVSTAVWLQHVSTAVWLQAVWLQVDVREGRGSSEAFLIGNAAYVRHVLPTPHADVQAVGAALTRRRFRSKIVRDLDIKNEGLAAEIIS